MVNDLFELTDYVRADDATFAWSKLNKSGAVTTLRLVSQQWHNGPWSHSLVITEPKRRLVRGSAILYITGGHPNPLDQDEATRLADLSGLPVAHLFDIPNQPIFDLSEDDLIAESFVRYLDSGDPSWPLLLPMVKSVVRAMDALQQLSAKSQNPLSTFVVTGASKRAWTAWLVPGIGDPRVIGIAPMVYDNLNIPLQMQRQIETWHAYSEMIQPYTLRGLQDRLSTAEGQRLSAIVDPYSYRERLTLPKLVVTGANDPYWSVDSMELYWDGLVGPKWASVVPNAGHGLGDMAQALGAIAAFSKFCCGKLQIPAASWTFGREAVEVRLGPPLPSVTMWVAESQEGDFRNAHWWPRIESGPGKLGGEAADLSFRVPPSSKRQAVFLAFAYSGFVITTPVKVYP